MEVGIGGIRRGAIEFLQVIYRALACLLSFCSSFEFEFLTTPFWGRGAPRGSTVVQLDRTMVCSHRLLIETTVVTGIVWPNTVITSFGEGAIKGIGDGSPM